MCGLCKPATSMDRSTMITYKYQVIVEGIGMSSDSSFWKLRSNSLVFWLTTGGKPLWVPWYFSILQPNLHYIPSSKEDILTKLGDCLKADNLCKGIAKNAENTMNGYTTPSNTLRYTINVLLHIRKMHKNTLHL